MFALWVVLDYRVLHGYDKPTEEEGMRGHELSQFVNELRFQGPQTPTNNQWGPSEID